MAPHIVEMLYAIGAGDKIIGAIEYSDYPEAAKKIERVGNYHGIQIERVLELKPDLVIVWESGNKQEDIRKLQQLGIKTLTSKPRRFEDISKEILAFGKHIGHEKQAIAVTKQLQKDYLAIKNQYKSKKAVKVFYQMWHDPLRTVGPASWIENLIRSCNGKNIFNDATSDYPIVSIESVIVKNPEVIVVPHHSGNIGAKKAIWKNWQEIPAVKNNHLFTLNGDLLHRFTPRAIEGLTLLCQSIDSAR
nr:cobalamin-binding protein [Pleionea sp. CnH1-48]